MQDVKTKEVTKKAVKKEVKIITSITSVKFTKDFMQAEEAIRKANTAFLVIGKNLNAIQENALYKQRGYNSFEVYIRDIFDFTRDYGYKLMSAYLAVNALENAGFTVLPKTESQARPLTKLLTPEDIENELLVSVWGQVLELDNITALSISTVVDAALGKSQPIKEKVEEISPDKPASSVSAKDLQAENDALRIRIKELENKIERDALIRTRVHSDLAKRMIKEGHRVVMQDKTLTAKDQLELAQIVKELTA